MHRDVLKYDGRREEPPYNGTADMNDERVEVIARSIMRQERKMFGSFPPLEDMKRFVANALNEADGEHLEPPAS